MVASTINLPNIRKMFIPDEGYTIIDADLEKADAQIVAWESGDEELKQIFREGRNLYEENARMIFNTASPSKEQYYKAKAGVHLTDYGGKARRLAEVLGSTIHEADIFQKRWFSAHPRILAWHKRVQIELKQYRKVTNPFGFERFYFDRVESIFTEALAWVPQSAVAIVTNKGLLNIDNNILTAQLLLQVHDSLVLQVPTELTPDIYQTIHSNMLIPIPYSDPLTIPVSIAASTKSWGDCKPVEV